MPIRIPLALTALIITSLLIGVSAYAVTGRPFAPGETLDPGCGPHDPSCFVMLPPTFATTTLTLPDLFSVSGTLSVAGLDPVQVLLATQPANHFFAAPGTSSGAPSFRLISDQDLPNPLHKDVVGTVYGDFVGGSVHAASATTTHLYASVGRFDTLTVGGRVIGADELAASTLCGLPVAPQPEPMAELDFSIPPAILSDTPEDAADLLDSPEPIAPDPLEPAESTPLPESEAVPAPSTDTTNLAEPNESIP